MAHKCKSRKLAETNESDESVVDAVVDDHDLERLDLESYILAIVFCCGGDLELGS